MSLSLDYRRVAVPALCLLLIGFTLVYCVTVHYYNRQISEKNEKLESYRRTSESLMMENLSLRSEVSKLREESRSLNMTIRYVLENYTQLLNEINKLNERLKSIEDEKNMLISRASYLEKIVRLEIKTTLFNQTIELRERRVFNYVFKLNYAGYVSIIFRYSIRDSDIPSMRVNITNVFQDESGERLRVYESTFETSSFAFERSMLVPVLPGSLIVNIELLSGEATVSLSITYTY